MPDARPEAQVGGSLPPAVPSMIRAMSDAPPAFRTILEEPTPLPVPLWVHPEWAAAFPWLAQGTTGRGHGEAPFDLALFGSAPAREALERWWALGRALDTPRMVHARQVHGAAVRFHRNGPPGLHVAEPCDGHVTRTPGVLLGVTTADCVPIQVVAPRARAVAALHGGWRGVAAGILERGLHVLGERLAVDAAGVHVHLGPAICGDCYEVGPEVHAALGLDVPAGPAPVDLRAALARRAVAAGVSAECVTVSGHCTRCGGSPFFSHRGGCRERQLGVLGVRCGS